MNTYNTSIQCNFRKLKIYVKNVLHFVAFFLAVFHRSRRGHQALDVHKGDN